MPERNLLELKEVSKSFSGVPALKKVNMAVRRGTVHALCGENGAGKSTLIKIISRVYHEDSGQLSLDGIPLTGKTPEEVRRLGVNVVYQDLNLVPHLTIAQNILLGQEPTKWAFIDWREMKDRAERAMQRITGEQWDVKDLVCDLTVAQQQLVAIARAVFFESKLLILDEPTGRLSVKETENLFRIVEDLKAKGLSIIYITHRLDEIYRIADYITVLRDGMYVDTIAVEDSSPDQLVRLMIGRELKERIPKEEVALGEEVLRVEELSLAGVFKSISFAVRRGEIFGITGVVGAKKTELLETIFGINVPTTGRVVVAGREVPPGSVDAAIRAGLSLTPEDRRRNGLVPEGKVRENITLIGLRKLLKYGLIQGAKERSTTQGIVERLRIKSHSIEQMVINLSGGNQQKTVIGKWLARGSDVYLLDEPTNGVDVGARIEIYRSILELARNGAAIVFVSSDMEEVRGICDRIMVMHEGGCQAELAVTEASAERLLYLAMGGSSDAAS